MLNPASASLTEDTDKFYFHRSGGVAKTVIAPACQAGDRGFNSRRFRNQAN